uniref:Forkhead box protein fkh-2 n=1 Tax=Plectus sambesii TaxID=2011161 RepID=A0A914X1F5_9BILA
MWWRYAYSPAGLPTAGRSLHRVVRHRLPESDLDDARDGRRANRAKVAGRSVSLVARLDNGLSIDTPGRPLLRDHPPLCLSIASSPRARQLCSLTHNQPSERGEMIEQKQPDDGLTSLNWLVQPAKGLGLNPPTPPTTPPSVSTLAADIQQQQNTEPHRPDYRNELIKPPYSYAQLITMAMQAHGCEKVVLTDIYHWIRENFAYFRCGDNSWQNSIRHNLSLNKQFIKVPRDHDDKGKGSYWMLDPKSKDPYCIRRRNFVDCNTKRMKPTVTRPQVNPAIKSFIEKTIQGQQCTSRSAMDISLADSPVPTGQTYVYEEYGTPKIFRAENTDGFTYVPQNDLRPVVLQNNEEYNNPRAPDERVKVEYNWEGYEYHPSGVGGVQLPLQLSPGGTQQGIVVGSVGLSPPNSDDSDGQAGLELRIPTPEWWGHQVTTASLMSPMNGSHHNPLARVFENLTTTSANSSNATTPMLKEHPWQEERREFPHEDGLFTLEPMSIPVTTVCSFTLPDHSSVTTVF